MINYVGDAVESRFYHNCHIECGASGSPILGLNNKVIGIHISQIRKDLKREGHFLNYPIKDFIQQNKIMNKKEIITKENVLKNNNLSIQERLMEMFNLIRKHLGQDIFEELNELYLSSKITFKNEYYRNHNYLLETCKNIIKQTKNYVYKIKLGNRETIGFFCKIPFPNKDNMLSVFITNNNILNEEILNKKDEKILIDIKEEKKLKK